MNKVVGVGIVIVIISIIIGVVYSVSSPDTNEGNLPASEKIINEESEYTGTDYSVELTEKMGLKTP